MNKHTEAVLTMQKLPFVSESKLREIEKHFPTPFYLYDEAGIANTARDMNRAFSWNNGFREYYAVKACPNPFILKILKDEGCGADCSSFTELMLAEAVGFSGDEIMFSSNETPAGEFEYARQLDANINLDDITHIEFLRRHGGGGPEGAPDHPPLTEGASRCAGGGVRLLESGGAGGRRLAGS